MFRASLAVLLSIVCVGVLAARPGATSRQGQQPVFRASADLVVVDVSAIDRNGAPVTDLLADDFTVRIDGRPRRVVSIQYIDRGQPAAGVAGMAPPRFSANDTGGAGRLVMIAVDEAGIRFGGLRSTVESVDRLLAGFGPTDRFALATLSGPRLLVAFTDDRTRVIEAMKRVTGGATMPRPPGRVQLTVTEAFAIVRSDTMTFQDVFQRECGRLERDPLAQKSCATDVTEEARRIVIDARNRTAEFAAAMRSVLQSLQAIDGPKIVVLFSEGLESLEAANDLSSLSTSAAAARAAIFPMKLDRPDADASGRQAVASSADDRSAPMASLELLAGGARGTVFDLASTPDSVFDRFAREVSGYYLLGVEPEGNAHDGNPHQIAVAVRRPGVTVRARPQFVFNPPAPDDAALLSATLQAPLLAADLPVRLAAFNIADDDPGKVRVLISAEIDRQQSQGGIAMVALELRDELGKTVMRHSREQRLDRAESGALSFVITASVAPGRYTAKLAAVREGRAGSVEREIQARLSDAAPLVLGDLVVGDPPVTAGKSAPPVDGRVSGDRVWCFTRVGPSPGQPSSPMFVVEVARSADGPALLSSPATTDTGPQPTRTVQADLDARLLPPGNYVARLTATSNGKMVARILAPFAFERARHTLPAILDGRPPLRGGDAGGTPFRREDALEPAVLGPLLDDVIGRVPTGSRPAILAAKSGRFDEALRLARAGGAAPDPTESFLRGLLALQQGRLEAASDAFRDAIRIDPEFTPGRFYLGVCHAAGGREVQAISAWESSLVGLQRFPVVYRFLVDAEMREGRPDRAAELLEEALSRWPDDASLQANMSVLVEGGRYERVLDVAASTVDKQPGNTPLLLLVMKAVFLAVADRPGADAPALLASLTRYRDLYLAADGRPEPLIDEWVAFVASRVKK